MQNYICLPSETLKYRRTPKVAQARDFCCSRCVAMISSFIPFGFCVWVLHSLYVFLCLPLALR